MGDKLEEMIMSSEEKKRSARRRQEKTGNQSLDKLKQIKGKAIIRHRWLGHNQFLHCHKCKLFIRLKLSEVSYRQSTKTIMVRKLEYNVSNMEHFKEMFRRQKLGRRTQGEGRSDGSLGLQNSESKLARADEMRNKDINMLPETAKVIDRFIFILLRGTK